MEGAVRELSIGYSPCPNDTFIFHALIHGKIRCDNFHFRERLEDVETLNRIAFDGELDITKVSFHAFAHLRNRYRLLRSGGALGKGCGPLLVAKENFVPGDIVSKDIAIPGEFTTAYLLLRLYRPEIRNVHILPFHEIMPAVANGRVAAGLIIHESRFTYQKYGLQRIVDLGEWWEETTGYPIPLGGIIMKRSAGIDDAHFIEEKIRESIRYAHADPGESRKYIRAHAQEMEESVMQRHINLYVNEYSLDIGEDGENAIRFLFEEAEQKKIIPASLQDIF